MEPKGYWRLCLGPGRAPQGEDFFFFGGEATAYGILIPQPGIEPMRPAMEAQTPNHWTTREVPQGEDFEEGEGTGWVRRSLGSACVHKALRGVQQRSLLCGGRVGDGELKTPKPGWKSGQGSQGCGFY